MHPEKEEVRQEHQKVSMDEQGAPGKAQTRKGSLQTVQAMARLTCSPLLEAEYLMWLETRLAR